MSNLARALSYMPYRQNIVTMRDGTVFEVDDEGHVLDPQIPSIVYVDFDEIDDDTAAELQTMHGFSDDDAEPADHNIFDMLVPGCPARPEGLDHEFTGPFGRCRHCGGR